MPEIFVSKIGYYSLFEIEKRGKVKYKVDSGETIYLARFKKTIVNPYRDIKEFATIEKAKEYAKKKLLAKSRAKKKVLKKLPKSLYLVLLKEKASGITFVKVGFTTKRFIYRRFSNDYGYEGYILESILRRVNTQDAEKLEKEIKDRLNKNREIKKYRPLLESFSGYSECYNYLFLTDIVRIFDEVAGSS